MIAMALLMGLAGNVAANVFNDNGVDHLWNTAGNWSQGVPDISRTDGGQWGNMTVDGTICIIDSTHVAGNTASAGGVYPGCYGGDNEFYMSGGELTCFFFNIGRGDSDSGSNGYFEMTGGIITTQHFQIPNQFDSVSGNITGHVDLHGGTTNVTGGFHMGSRISGASDGGIGTMDVASGTLIVNGNDTSTIQGYIDNGWITAYGGNGYFELDYDVRNTGKTTLTAVSYGQAFNPDPNDNATDVSIQSVLSWTAGVGADSHNVYLGTTDPPAFIQNQPLAETTYDPNGLLYGTTYYWRIDEVNGPDVLPGLVWTFTTGSPPAAAQNPDPNDGANDLKPNTRLHWIPALNADSHDVYFGTTNPPPLIGNQANTLYDPGQLDPNTTYYWRVDEKNIHGVTSGPVWSFTVSPLPKGDFNGDWLVNLLDLKVLASLWLDTACGLPDWCSGADLSRSTNVDIVDYALWAPQYSNVIPPYTDYCAMLSQEIQGKKHGFLAGNLTYYIGGFRPVWNHSEDETLGFTHPFHHDLRSRGHGMVQHGATGYGHDLQGWEFYKATKVAYGSVYVGAIKYTNPVPTAMYWRPDKMICEYNVGGVNIHEEKFIADNDVACTIITSDAPVTLEFAGQSFARDGKSVTRTATCELDVANNSVHVVEGGTIEVKPVDGEFYTGVLMYDGMSTVISASETLTDYSQNEITSGQWSYEFKVPCDSSGVSLVWAMDDVYSTAVSNIQDVLADPAGKMTAKTEYMNDILNYQIPYFRCSDQDIVDIYYYLWSLYHMYMIDVDQGFEQYPHTQTAVNNFLGLHRYDATFQIQVGSWAADKEQYANGNVLIWSALLPYANLSTGRIPADNMGIGWYSGLWGQVTSHVEGAWKIYEHSGDISFLNDTYSFYKALMWQSIPGVWGYEYSAADRLAMMAVELGYPDDVDHWYDLVNMDNINNWLNCRWEVNGVNHYFAAGTGTLGWSGMAYMAIDQFPDQWAWEMSEYWATNSVDGFFSTVPLSTIALKDWGQVSDVFTITPDTNWWAIRGMYKHHVGNNANICTLGHLKGYNLEWGIPVAPESLDFNYEPWGDEYSNFNAGKILLILEGICGLSYSVIDDSFTISDHLPMEWDYMETFVPIHENGQTQWTRVRVSRIENSPNVEKTITVKGNSQSTLNIQPWLEEKNLLTAPGGYINQQPQGHIGYTFNKTEDKIIVIYLQE